MPYTFAYRSRDLNDGLLYHDNTDCDVGKTIAKDDRIVDDVDVYRLALCPECKQLTLADR